MVNGLRCWIKHRKWVKVGMLDKTNNKIFKSFSLHTLTSKSFFKKESIWQKEV